MQETLTYFGDGLIDGISHFLTLVYDELTGEEDVEGVPDLAFSYYDFVGFADFHFHLYSYLYFNSFSHFISSQDNKVTLNANNVANLGKRLDKKLTLGK